ncbi:MAG: hypothetical protein RL139_94 [Gemmatimonadota bacterium]|jgi:hypothetical protein
MTTHSNGEKVKVITRWGDPTVSCNVDHGGAPCPEYDFSAAPRGLLYHRAKNGIRTFEVPDPDPLTVLPDCHTGRQFTNPIVRQMLAALGVRICTDCDRYIGIAGRSRWRERP